MAKTNETVTPDYQVALAKGEIFVNILVKNDEYTVNIDGLNKIKTEDDLLGLQELLNTAIGNITLFNNQDNVEFCDDECETCEHVGPCYV